VSRSLALDVGERRIGVAVSDASGLIASPLEVVHRRSKVEDYARIAELCLALHVDLLVVGHPLNADDSVGPGARRIERYAVGLAQDLEAKGVHVTLLMWDEHGSTLAACSALVMTGRGARARRERIDSAAAAVILQDYLDAHRSEV
jgi:putative holliday junction resolvase